MVKRYEIKSTTQRILFEQDFDLNAQSAFKNFIITIKDIFDAPVEDMIERGQLTDAHFRGALSNRIQKESIEKGLIQWLKDQNPIQIIEYEDEDLDGCHKEEERESCEGEEHESCRSIIGIINPEEILRLIQKAINRTGTWVFHDEDLIKQFSA